MKDDKLAAPTAETTGETLEGESEVASESDGEGAETLLELILAEHEAHAARAEEPAEERPARVDGVLIGRLIGFAASGEALVEHRWSGGSGGLAARAMALLTPADVGREVALLFEGGDLDRPVVMGLMHGGGAAASAPARAPRPEVASDGGRLVFDAEQEIVFRCGKSSITLTRAGKILIRGAYLLARSSGVNRIQGGSVQIN